MLPKEKMDRINELARKSKVTELGAEEKEEQQQLRQEYIKKFREVFRGQLEQIHFVDENGVIESPCKKSESSGKIVVEEIK